jgi:peptidoglycan/xylan/chitin deacetylase (PgdA/CDA1 family)
MRNQATILMYHAIGSYPAYRWSVTLDQFEQQMAYLAKSDCKVISFAELIRRLTCKEPLREAIVLTFDDGYRDNLYTALPVLEQYKFPAIIFVSPGLEGQTNPEGVERLSTDELRELAASPLITIGSHATTHPKLATLPETAGRKEVRTSREMLTEQIGEAPQFFSYPHGSVNSEVAQWVQEAGFLAGVTTRVANVRPHTSPFLLPRHAVDSSTAFSRFRAMAKGKLNMRQILRGMSRPNY